MQEVLSKESVISLLSDGVNDAEWMLSQIESDNGWVRFPPYILNLIKNLKIESYPLLYQNENSIVAMLLKGFLSDDEIKDFNNTLESLSPDERGEVLLGFTHGLSEVIDKIEIPKTPKQQQEANDRFNSLSKEDQLKSIKISQHFFCSFLASFYQMLSIMVHGQKLTDLVSRALAGDDVSFVKAIQIDRRILTTIPYFIDRFTSAQENADSDFLDALSYRLNNPPYRGKVRYKTLWLAFSVLEMAGLLDNLKHKEILDICDEAGVGAHKNRIESVKHLTSRLAEYRKFQQKGIKAT